MSAQWRVVYGAQVFGPFPAPQQMEPIVTGLRNAWAAGEATRAVVTLQVDAGDGWQIDEVIDFAHEDEDEDEEAA